jgi:hypothetical protein
MIHKNSIVGTAAIHAAEETMVQLKTARKTPLLNFP